VLTVIVEDPAPETDAGLKFALAPDGNPLTLKPTALLNPPLAATLTV
jgi:hypothetical protein